jgi:hypothetical protein
VYDIYSVCDVRSTVARAQGGVRTTSGITKNRQAPVWHTSVFTAATSRRTRAKQSCPENRTSTEKYRAPEAPAHDTTLHSDHAEIPGRWRYPDIAHLSDELWSMPRRLCTITITITIIYRPLASRTDIGLRHPSTTLLNQSRLLHTPNQLKTRTANAVSSCANSARVNSAPDMLQSKRHATTLW